MAAEHREVVILGGGPAGSTLASRLAQRGRRALVLEREKFPRFHIGESLLPRSCEVFEKLGVTEKLEQRYIRKYGARFLCSETRRVNAYSFKEAFDGRYDHAYQVPRGDFDHLLLQHAVELGAEVREEWEATEVLFEGDRAVGVKARPCPGGKPGEVVEIRAPIVVDATGRDTLLASRMRRKAAVARLDKTAFFTHWTGAFREEGIHEGNIQIVIFEHGWFWFIPFKGDLSSVGVVCSTDWVKQRKKDETLDAFYDRTVAASGVAARAPAPVKARCPAGVPAPYPQPHDRVLRAGRRFEHA